MQHYSRLIFEQCVLTLSGLKTVKTEDIDVSNVPSKEGELQRQHAIPGQISRDTADARFAGGKQVIRMVTTKQRTNPYNALGMKGNNKLGSDAKNDNDNDVVPIEELTMGQKLAMKHYLMDPKKKNESKVSCIYIHDLHNVLYKF